LDVLVYLRLEEDRQVEALFHGTRAKAAEQIFGGWFEADEAAVGSFVAD